MKTKRAVIDEAIRTLILLHKQGEVRQLRGQLHWKGDIDAARLARISDQISSGITVRKTIDSPIATYCIANQVFLLHNDSDFDGYERHLGLKVVHP